MALFSSRENHTPKKPCLVFVYHLVALLKLTPKGGYEQTMAIVIYLDFLLTKQAL